MMLPSGVDLTLTELQEMATRQQRQIEEQQQMLVAKEQRLKFLKQQELRHQQIASENERLRKLREKVEAQELKLKKLRALRGQVNDQKTTNNSLSSELEAIKALFSEKEKELSVAVSRVDDLTHQLESLRQGRINGLQHGESGTSHPAVQELHRLRKEVTMRNKLNEQQNSKLLAHREILQHRKQEIASMDARIAELQLRLRSKKQVHGDSQKPGNRNHSNNILSSQGVNKGGWSGNVAAVEPYRVNQEQVMSKQDPKYQSLPYNVKFPDTNKENRSVLPDTDRRALPDHQTGTKPVVRAAVGFVPGSHTPTHPPSLPQSSPSILYASGESPGSPKTSTPLSTAQPNRSTTQPDRSTAQTNQHNRPSNREIFITGAPSTNLLPAHARTGSYTGPDRDVKPTTHRLSPNILSTQNHPPNIPPQHHKQGSTDSQSQGYVSQAGQHARQGSNEYTQPPNQHMRQGSSEYTQHARQGSKEYTQDARQGSNEYSRASTQHTQSGPGPLREGDYVSHQSVQHARQASDDRTPGHKQALDDRTSHKPASDDRMSHKQALQTRSESAGVLPAIAREPGLPRQAQSDSNLPGNQPNQSNSGKPYRYASHDVIASTYMGKKHPGAMDQYKKNVSHLLKGIQQEPDVAMDTDVAMNTETGTQGDNTPHVYNIDPELSRYPAKPNAPRPLRRRLSSGGDSPEAARYRGQGTEEGTAEQPVSGSKSGSMTTEGRSVSGDIGPVSVGSMGGDVGSVSAEIGPVSGPPDVVRVDDIQADTEEEEVFTENSDTQRQADTSDTQQTTDTQPIDTQQTLDTSAKESLPVALRRKKGNLKKQGSVGRSRRVSFDPLALLLDAALEGELDLVVKSAHEVSDPSCPNDEGITALHNAICAGHYDIVKFLVEYGCDVNSPDSDGWTPLHCAASCNNLPMVQLLVEHGACILATTVSDQETAAEKCEEDEEGYQGCSQYLYSTQEKLGVAHKGRVYGVFDYSGQNEDELSFCNGDALTVVRKGDATEKEWWWAKNTGGRQGYIPRNLTGMYPRVTPKWQTADKE